MGKAKLNIPMCAALVLLFLTMLSIHLTSGLYARYTATSTASDSARVAKFDVEGTDGGTVLINSSSSNDGKYSFSVTNDSEVAISYTLDIQFASTANGWLGLTLDQTATDVGEPGTFSNDTTCSFSTVYYLAPGGAAEHAVLFSVLDWTPITRNNTEIIHNTSDTWSLNFEVLIHAQQVD